MRVPRPRSTVEGTIRRAWREAALVRIGKRGITEEVVKEIKRHLKQRGAVKVRILKSAIAKEGKDRRELARTLAIRVGAKLAGVRGYTLVLYKPGAGG